MRRGGKGDDVHLPVHDAGSRGHFGDWQRRPPQEVGVSGQSDCPVLLQSGFGEAWDS